MKPPVALELQIKEYLDSMSPKEKKGYEIAKSHLGSSFQIEKSIGFIAFQKKQSQSFS
jgi:hypothetical protein